MSYNKKSFKISGRNDFAFFVAERHKFFVNRVAPSWNGLPSNVINFSSLNGFRAALDNFTKNGHKMAKTRPKKKNLIYIFKSNFDKEKNKIILKSILKGTKLV